LVKTGSIATKVALVVSAVVVAALAAGVFAAGWTGRSARLDQASRRLNTNLAIAERIFEAVSRGVAPGGQRAGRLRPNQSES
jgi:hypothetical protein